MYRLGPKGIYCKKAKTYEVNGHVLTEEEAECISTLYHTVQNDVFSDVDKDKLGKLETWNKTK